ncbi:PspC domain-containing protein [Pontibacter vulgaris]|uniref:PspC domain-containing protein n=1 Tax=Pontibacter vulgaris TaxID=2905679 RepID=UPI001FA6C44B|nr:PspC domain-containing protein [Pontibacter vulgaris]
MKKNISINLQGIIFYIEEDGYEQLSRYLASIRKYFSTYEGHEEIVADIEYRIAEIFSSRLSPAKQVITLEDIQYLIARMGNVTDFEVLDEVEEETAYTSATGNAGAGSSTYTAPGTRRLYRDVNRKVLGGVCAGIANYLNIDTLWIRLFFILFVVLGIISAGVSTATGIIIYGILWIAMPQSDQLPETTVKKLFRDPEDKKLGGVASGIAKYFGVDVAVVRILFLISIFLGGFGILAYIVLWIAVPEAVTLTERMQMQGDPVTLAGIEHTLKENLNMKDRNGEESALAKIILLPIRLISQVINWLGKALGPILAFLITLIRVGAGILLIVISVGLTIALFSTLFVSLGLVDESQYVSMGDFPASVFLEGFPRLGIVAGFIVGLIPLLLLIFLALALLTKRFFLRPIVGWSLFGVWLVSLFILIATIIAYAGNFKRSGEVVVTKTIPAGNYKTLTLDAYDMDNDFDHVYVDVRESTGNDIQVIQRVEAKGKTEAEAQKNARMVTYRFVQTDSVLRFDNSYEFKKGAAFRDQDLEIQLYLPKNKPLRLTEEFTYMLPSATFDRDYSTAKIVRNTWQVKGDMLECLTCAADTLDNEEDEAYNLNNNGDVNVDVEGIRDGESVLMDMDAYGTYSQTFNLKDFRRISIAGPYHVQIRQGNYSVRVRGDRDEIRRLDIDQNGQELVIESTRRNFNLFEDKTPVLIQITAPNIEDIDLGGAIKADIGNISTDNLGISLSGATKATAQVNVRDLKIDIAGASASKFTGRASHVEMDIAGACHLDADGLQANSVDIDATGVSIAEVYATQTLRAEASGTSQITYGGNPKNTDIDASGPSKVTRR